MRRREFLITAAGGAAAPFVVGVRSVCAAAKPADARGVAMAFFEGLRDGDRAGALSVMTPDAAGNHGGRDSAVMRLPVPAGRRGAIRAKRPRVDGGVAEVAVAVTAGGRRHDTTVHLRDTPEGWRVFALSATYPDGDRSINFEAETQIFDPTAVRAIAVGEPMPLEGITLANAPLDTAALAGRVVLVDFWATWCPPCRAEIPNIRENYARHRDAGFEVVAISVDKDMNALQRFVADERLPWTVVADRHPTTRNSMGDRYGVSSIPSMTLLGRDGKVAAVGCRGERLDAELARLLAA